MFPPPPHVCVRNKPVWFPPLHPPPILPMPLGGGGGRAEGIQAHTWFKKGPNEAANDPESDPRDGGRPISTSGGPLRHSCSDLAPPRGR